MTYAKEYQLKLFRKTMSKHKCIICGNNEAVKIGIHHACIGECIVKLKYLLEKQQIEYFEKTLDKTI